MRTILVALVALFTFGTITTQATAGAWKCRGPAYACNANGYGPVANKRYAKRSVAKKTYSKNRYAKKPYTAPKKQAKKTYSKSKKYAKATYSKSNSSGHRLQGQASYYWQRQRVASGGWFNPNAMTAAHKTLPFGTRVRVTNKHNGRSVVVSINDRGPYVKGRIIDLSKAAAYQIGMQGSGVVPVSVEVL